jgi:hypothetical protein
VPRCKRKIHFSVMAGLDSRLSDSALLLTKTAEICCSLPLTLPLCGSLPLPARGERAGVRGFCRPGAPSTRPPEGRQLKPLPGGVDARLKAGHLNQRASPQAPY